MAAAICATIDGREYLKALLAKLGGKDWSWLQLWAAAQEVVDEIDSDSLYTNAFNKHAVDQASQCADEEVSAYGSALNAEIERLVNRQKIKKLEEMAQAP